MRESKLVILRGLPASGKTTYAKKLVEEGGGNVKRVNRDSLREMIDNGGWSGANEAFITKVRDDLLRRGLRCGHTVISDDTNLNPVVMEGLKKLAEEEGAMVEVVDLTNVSPAICLARDDMRPAKEQVGKKVIMDMYNKFLRPTQQLIPKGPAHDPTKTDCIIVDIDGTIAEHGERNLFDESDAMLKDAPRLDIIDAVRRLAHGRYIIFVSGRSEDARPWTEMWLTQQGLKGMLFMRKSKDVRRDSIVKKEIYLEKIAPYYNVRAVLDDRPQVLNECWRPLGLPTFDVGMGVEF